MATNFIWSQSSWWGNAILRQKDGTTSFVIDTSKMKASEINNLLRLLNDPLARETLKLTRKDLHNLEG